MAYSVSVLPEALRSLSKLPKQEQRRIADKIDALSGNPRPSGAKALQGTEKGLHRIRIGEYRVVYRIEDGKLAVLVIRVGHRKEIYR